MTGLSKCCGARVYEEAEVETPYTEFYHRETYCSKCHKPLSNLNKGELLAWLNIWVRRWSMMSGKEKQAYQQIRKLINNSVA